MWRNLLQKSISGHVDAPLPTKTGQLQLRAFARPFSLHPDAQPDYTLRMTHYAHTPIPLDFMSETRSMTEKSSASVTKRPQDRPVSPVRVSAPVARPLANLQFVGATDPVARRTSNVPAVSVGGQCRRSVSAVSVYATYATCATIRSKPSLPARSYPVPRPENGKNYENHDSLHTVYI